jgi:hypothetical protein
LFINIEEILSCADENFEEKNKVFESLQLNIALTLMRIVTYNKGIIEE